MRHSLKFRLGGLIMKKKVVSLVLGAVLAVGSLAGCGSGETTTPETTKETAGDEAAVDTEEEETEAPAEEGGNEDAAVTLKWAIWDQKTAPYWDAVADAYMEKNPDVSIEMTDLGASDYMTVLGTELSGKGSDFDVVTIKDVPGYATLVGKGVLEPMSEMVSADGIDLSIYNGTAEQVTVDGELYQMPFRTDFWLLYYNKDLYDEAGVAYPTNDMTMEEYDEMVRSVSKQGFGDEQIFGAHYHTWRSAVQLFGILDGEHSVVDGNYDFTKSYYEMVKKQEEDGICRTYIDTNASQLHYSAAFAEGNTATMNMGTWYIATLMDSLKTGEYDTELCGNWGLASYPHPEGVEAGTTLGQVTGLAIPTASEQKEAAWEFIKFACGEEGAEVVAQTGTFPAIMNDDVIDTITSLEGFPDDEATKEALKTTQIYLEAPYDDKISEINNILDTYHKDIMNGDTSIDDGIAKMNEEVGAILE